MRSAALPLRLMGLEVGLGEALQCSGRRDLMLVSGLSPAGICGPVLPRAPSVTCWDPSCVRQLHVGPHQAHQQLLMRPEQAVVVSSAAATLGLPREDAGASGVNHPEGDSHTFDGLLRSRPRRCCHRNATCSPELHRSPSRRPVGWWGRVGIHDSTTTGPRRPGSIAGRPLWVPGGLRLGPRHARSAQAAPILALLVLARSTEILDFRTSGCHSVLACCAEATAFAGAACASVRLRKAPQSPVDAESSTS